MTQQTTVKVSQQIALLIESLRGLGWSEDELAELAKRKNGLPKDNSVFEFDYEELAVFAAGEPEIYESAVRKGYQIKFNTLGGLRSWLYVAFGMEPHIDRRPGLEGVTAILTNAQLERLETALSFGWRIEKIGESLDEGKATYRLEPIQR
ncbi:hypothetical protein [Gorillibacterium massiliense]|uniref:hypothetical protein n=1 Tax=Gorillibacterium massiliense TaxID=1280390 RepID=UPI0004B33855|nr:hypothetical protein [Gorillibacterium massiliense]